MYIFKILFIQIIIMTPTIYQFLMKKEPISLNPLGRSGEVWCLCVNVPTKP